MRARRGRLRVVRRLLPLLVIALAGCGSAAPGDLPAPAEFAASPPPSEPAAGRPVPAADARDAVSAGDAATVRGRTVRSDREAGVLRVGGRAVRVPGLLAPDGLAATATGDLLVVDARRRRLVLLDGRTLSVLDAAPAGVGPTRVVSGGRFAYVADTAGESLLVFALREGAVDPIRYVHLPGSPGPLAIDRARAYRVWVALPGRNEVVGLPAHGRPHLVDRLPTVPGVRALGADEATGRVTVLGSGGAVAFDPPGT